MADRRRPCDWTTDLSLLGLRKKEPVFSPEEDVELGKMSAQSLAEDPEGYPILTGDYINASILKELMGLSYSRDQEAQAGDDVGIPEILSDHPDSGSRVRETQRKPAEEGQAE
ncbi:MAG: hypothetical protein HKN10_10945 [Myxococcales bacterium]|nr:hypothetical protein [Deltaproteobacteria bacterium]NNE18982.1 hypothetical protein [Myxococcales bacterium]